MTYRSPEDRQLDRLHAAKTTTRVHPSAHIRSDSDTSRPLSLILFVHESDASIVHYASYSLTRDEARTIADCLLSELNAEPPATCFWCGSIEGDTNHTDPYAVSLHSFEPR